MSDEQDKPGPGTEPTAGTPASLPAPEAAASVTAAATPSKADEDASNDRAADDSLGGGSRAAKWDAELRQRGKYTELAALLAFLVPGLGHIYLGRPMKGLIAFVVLVGLFGWGIGISRGECVSLAQDEESGHRYAFVAQVGVGLPVALALLNTHTFEVKNALGLLGPDAHKTDERPSNHYEDPEYVNRLPRLDEGLLYTMIAGLLNLLLIYDAFLGSPGAALRPKPEESLPLVDVEPEPTGGEPPPAPPPEPPPAAGAGGTA